MDVLGPGRGAIVVYAHIVGLALIRALGRAGVPVVVFHYDACEMGQFSNLVQRRVRVPSPLISQGDFIDALVGLGSAYQGWVLFPGDDYTLLALARGKSRLSPFYAVATMDWETVQTLVDKASTSDFARRVGVPCPETFPLLVADDLERGISRLGFPCLVKPCHGHVFFSKYRRKLFCVRNREEARLRVAELRERGIEAVLQEYVPGPASAGVNYNAQCKDGAAVAEFTARKVRLEPPVFGSPRVIRSEKVPEVVEAGRLLLRTLRFDGFACVEFKRDSRDGVYKLMEINARHNLSGSLAVRCGINFPLLSYRQLLGGATEGPRSFLEGVYWIDFLKDFMRFFVSRRTENYGWKEYLGPYRGERVFAVWDRSDPMPFLARCAYILRKSLGLAGRTA